jgi:RNA methyltransferase, TrmH family
VLTSVKNPKVASVLKLKKHAFRESAGRFLVEGAQAVGEALADPGWLEQLYVSDDLDPLAVRARESGVEVLAVSHEVMARLTSTVTPQGFVGVAPFLDTALEALPAEGCVPILHEVRDPGNAGTVLRSADASGARGIVFTASSVDVYNPKTVRASAGSVFHLPVIRGVSTQDAVAATRDRGFRVLAMDAGGEEDLYRTDLSGPTAFLFGNEAHGLPPEIVALADETVRVPQAGRAESLNLAAAATVCLFEHMRRASEQPASLDFIIAAAAHDIRSPLTAMKGFGYAIERRWDTMTEEQRALMLQGIVYDADRMDTIIRQLVDAARLVGGRLELFREQVDVPELVRGVAQVLGRDTDHPQVGWTGDAQRVFVDPARLRITIMAFVESLVWWARRGPVSIEGLQRGDRLLLVASRDDTDLSSEQADALFVPRRPGEGGGSKVGMFVARGVAEAQGGRAWGEVHGGRLSFHLEIPTGT